MQNLYTSADLDRIHSQLVRRIVWMLCIAAVFLGVAVWSMVIRLQWVTVSAVIAAGTVLIFGTEMFCRPVYAYEKLIRGALHGRNHTENLVYDHLEPESSMVDGVSCRSLVFLGTPDKHGTREQLYYWDAQIPLPAFESERTYAVRYTGKNIIGYSPAPAEA